MWMEERIGKRINRERADEAASTGADTVGVACPYCLIMLDDGHRARGDGVRVLDVAQVLQRSLGEDGPAAF
jgi:Fe-S oxidoreductase